jgi:hypothetical protein
MIDLPNPDNLSEADLQNIKSQLTMDMWESSILNNCKEWTLAWIKYGISYCDHYPNGREEARKGLIKLLEARA